MTYNVFSGTLNPTHSLTHFLVIHFVDSDSTGEDVCDFLSVINNNLVYLELLTRCAKTNARVSIFLQMQATWLRSTVSSFLSSTVVAVSKINGTEK